MTDIIINQVKKNVKLTSEDGKNWRGFFGVAVEPGTPDDVIFSRASKEGQRAMIDAGYSPSAMWDY